MTQNQPSEFAKRAFKLSLILIFISTFIVVFIGNALTSINKDIKELSSFITATSDLQSNFEQSLQLYTEGTEEAIEHTHALRPESESEYIDFISRVEDTAEDLDLDLSLKSIEIGEPEPDNKGATLDYQLSFYEDRDDINEFLEIMEGLPYYIKIYTIDYTDLDYLDEDDDKLSHNIKIKIRLYVK